THDRTERVGADPDVVVADRLALVHRVEGRDAVDVGSADAEDLGAGLDALGGDPTLDRLHQVEHRQQARAGLGIARGDVAQLVPGLGGQARLVLGELLGHRSTPPITGSMEAMATMTSATMPPSAITLVACRLVKDGSRK